MQYVFINNKPNDTKNFLMVKVVDYDWRKGKVKLVVILCENDVY